MQRYDEPGEKTRYFADDDAQDLESLVKRQRYEGAEDIDANLAENIARKATYKWVQHQSPGRRFTPIPTDFSTNWSVESVFIYAWQHAHALLHFTVNICMVCKQLPCRDSICRT